MAQPPTGAAVTAVQQSATWRKAAKCCWKPTEAESWALHWESYGPTGPKAPSTKRTRNIWNTDDIWWLVRCTMNDDINGNHGWWQWCTMMHLLLPCRWQDLLTPPPKNGRSRSTPHTGGQGWSWRIHRYQFIETLIETLIKMDSNGGLSELISQNGINGDWISDLILSICHS